MIIGVLGGTVTLIGVAMIILPGPAIVVIPAGLAILGLEFAWARHWLKQIEDRTRQTLGYLQRQPGSPPRDEGTGPPPDR